MNKGDKSELLWTLDDYEAHESEDIPGRITSNPELCEAEMMTADEVEEFTKDSIATLRILSDKAAPRYAEIRAMFVADMAALRDCGQIEDDEFEGLTSEENLRF